MAKDPEKARAAKRRYRRRKKIEKYGAAMADVDMRGRHGNHARGSASGRWNESGRMITSHGYVAVRAQPGDHHAWHTRGSSWYVYEHHKVMMEIIGRPLREGEVVHHLNGDRQDNSPGNLELTTVGAHAREHANAPGARDELGRFRSGGSRCPASRNVKGAEPREWPEDLRVREMPR